MSEVESKDMVRSFKIVSWPSSLIRVWQSMGISRPFGDDMSLHLQGIYIKVKGEQRERVLFSPGSEHMAAAFARCLLASFTAREIHTKVIKRKKLVGKT